MHRIEVKTKPALPDVRGQGLVKDIHDLGITTVAEVSVADIYWMDATLDRQSLELVCRSLLADPVTQDYSCDSPVEAGEETGVHTIEVAYNAGVADPVEGSVLKAIRDLGLNIAAVKTARKYLIKGSPDSSQLDNISRRLLVNPIIQHVIEGEHFAFPENPQYRFKLQKVSLQDKDTVTLARSLGFSENEFRAVTDYYHKQSRDATDVELETLAQTWSEHCVHKTFKSKVKFNGETIDNLLKSTIMKATRELAKPWCLSVFADNAGVVDFDGKWALCFKVETHNHPSALEPYGGAATGIGGVIRDPLGTGMGAKPILNTDVFCFGPPDFPYEKLPKGALHPRRTFKGVRSGVADYANRMGIPTLNGAIVFDDRYVANPLVYCGTLGIMPANMAQRGQQKPGDLVVVAGGRTGRDGIHGATFASIQLTEASSTASYTSVQIGNAIVEKKLIDVLLQARDRHLYSRITDCGAGGLSSAVGEMGADTGVRVDLDKVPLKYSGLSYTEIWISESQERMLLAVPPENIEALQKIFKGEDVEATVIGEFTDDRRLRLFYQGTLVGDLDMEFLHEGIPQVQQEATWKQPSFPEPNFPEPADLGDSLLAVLGSWNTCSKEWVIRQYDHEVQGANVLKPLVGKNSDGPGDAAIIRPVLDSPRGVIIANGINTRYGDIDPYWMAASVIDEALRQIIAVGGNLERVALLDNFCWGDTTRPEMLGALVRASKACHDMSLAYDAPFISGKDSLYNEFESGGKKISIPHTLLISSMGIMEDSGKAISMDLKQPGDLVYIVGTTSAEIGGSEYLASRGLIGNSIPKVDPTRAKKLMEALSAATAKGLVKACHDCSEGGLGVAIAEMAFAGGLGASISLQTVPLGEKIERDDYILFSESNSRFIVEVAPENKGEFEAALKGNAFGLIGMVTGEEMLQVYGTKGTRLLTLGLEDLKEAWQRPLRW